MYYIKWKVKRTTGTFDYFTGTDDAQPWSNDLKQAKLFHTPESAMSALVKCWKYWVDVVEVKYIHPLNVR